MIESSVQSYLVHVLDVLKSAALPTYVIVAKREHGNKSDDVRLPNCRLDEENHIKWLSHTIAKVLCCCRFSDYTNRLKVNLKLPNTQRAI